MMEWLFWLSAAGVVYAYLGYPLLVWWLARRRPAAPAARLDETLPDVTVIVPVHNERATIDAKLANTRALRYPAKLTALFVSDGSTDGTAEIIESGQDDRIRLIVLPNRGGKAGALNAGLAAASSPIVVFSDASIMLEPDSIRAIVRPFHAPDIG
jgi:poly-beta-1,6-N-acetyl-D-glucosamine synthase